MTAALFRSAVLTFITLVYDEVGRQTPTCDRPKRRQEKSPDEEHQVRTSTDRYGHRDSCCVRLVGRRTVQVVPTGAVAALGLTPRSSGMTKSGPSARDRFVATF